MSEHKFSADRRKLLKGAAAGVVVIALLLAYVFLALPGTPRVEKTLIATTTSEDWPRDFSFRSSAGGVVPRLSEKACMMPYIRFSRSGERFLCPLEARDKGKSVLVLDGKPVPVIHGKAHLYYGFFGDTPWWITYSEEAPPNRPTAITIGKEEILLPAGCNVTAFEGTRIFVITGVESHVIFNGKGLDHPYDSVDRLSDEISENGQVIAFSARLKGDPGRKVVVWNGEARTFYDANAPIVRNVTLNYDGSKVAYVLVHDNGDIIMVNGEPFDNKKHLCVIKTMFSPDGRTLGYLSLDEKATLPIRPFDRRAGVTIVVGESAIELGSVEFDENDIGYLKRGDWFNYHSIGGLWSNWYGFAPDSRAVYGLLDREKTKYVCVGNTCYDSVVVNGLPISLAGTLAPTFSKDGTRMAVWAEPHDDSRRWRVAVFDMTQAEKVGSISDPLDAVSNLALSPCGTFVAYKAYSAEDKKCQLFVNHKPIGDRFVAMSDPIFSADSTCVSYGAFDGVAFWHCTAKLK